MTTHPCIRVVFSTQSAGGFRGRTGLEHVCHICDKRLGIVRDFREIVVVSQETSPLIFSAQLAAEELDVKLELVDIGSMSIVQKLKEMVNGKPIPRIDIGEIFLSGSPTKKEIIETYTAYLKESIDLRTS